MGCFGAFSLLLLGIGSGLADKRVLLRDVQVLTLHRNRYTAGRRSAPIPELKCVGGSAGCRSFQPETVQCYNRGTDGSDVQWECKAEMPKSVRFGNVEVTCEGFDYPDDPYVLRGSCGLEYTLEKSSSAGGGGGWSSSSFWHQSPFDGNYGKARSLKVSDIVFFLFVATLIYALYKSCVVPPGSSSSSGSRSSWWPGGGNPPGPPPPGPGFRPEFYYGSDDCCQPPSSRSPFGGFWTGLGAGGLLGYLFGRNRGTSVHQNPLYPDSTYFGSSSFGGSSNEPDMAGPSTSTTTSTGYASTRRR